LRLIALGLRMSAEQHRDQAHPQATSAATRIQVTADDVDETGLLLIHRTISIECGCPAYD
jgi:hypothetical protein